MHSWELSLSRRTPRPARLKAQRLSLQVCCATSQQVPGGPNSAHGAPLAGAKGSWASKLQVSFSKVFVQRATRDISWTGRAHSCRVFRRLGEGRGDPSSPRRDAQPPRRLLPPGAQSQRALPGTYGARQLGRPGPEVDHRHPGVHGAAAGAASQLERTYRLASASLQLARTLRSLSVPRGAGSGLRYRWPCADWFAQWDSHPHWSRFAVTAPEQLLHLAFTVSTLSDRRKARGRLHQPGGSAACPPENRGRLEAVALANMRWHFCTLEAGSSSPTLPSDPLRGLHGEMRSKSFLTPIQLHLHQTPDRRLDCDAFVWVSSH